MTVDEYLAVLDLTALDPAAYNAACLGNLWDPDVQQFAALDRAYRADGGLEATQAWYAFTYTTNVPDLDILWCDAYTRMRLDYERQALPVLLEAVQDARTILVLGCGEGLELLFLAANLPSCQLTGMDLRPEAIALVDARAAKLGLKNVHCTVGDAFADPPNDLPPADWVVARNLLDDARLHGTDFTAGEFETVRKIRALRPLVRDHGHLWVSITSHPYSEDLDRRLTCEFLETGFQTSPARQICYRTAEGKSCVHLAWILWPLVDTGIEGLTPRPEYVPRYHYPNGRPLPFQDFLLGEQCYQNLTNPTLCPRCGTDGVNVTHADGPARTRKNFWKVWGRVSACPACARFYLSLEVLD